MPKLRTIAVIVAFIYSSGSKLFQIEDFHLVREEDTGKSRGFGFVKYEDSRSCILAVDNFTGVKVRSLHVVFPELDEDFL